MAELASPTGFESEDRTKAPNPTSEQTNDDNELRPIAEDDSGR